MKKKPRNSRWKKEKIPQRKIKNLKDYTSNFSLFGLQCHTEGCHGA